MIKLEKLRQSKVNPDVKNEINIYLLIKKMFMSVWDDNLGRKFGLMSGKFLCYLGKQTSDWSKTGFFSVCQLKK